MNFAEARIPHILSGRVLIVWEQNLLKNDLHVRNYCPRQIFVIVRDGTLLMFYFEPKAYESQLHICKICGRVPPLNKC